jgi:hypothetical protein
MRRILRVEHLVTVVAVAILVVTLYGVPDPPCSVTTPCAPDAWSWIALGVLLAPAVMVYLHRGAAAWASGVCAAYWAVAERWMDTGLRWAVLLPWALLAVAVYVARTGVDRVEHAAPRRAVPSPAVLPRVGGPGLAVAGVLLAAAAGAGAWVLWRQESADRQQAAARQVTGVVREQTRAGGTGAIRVALTGGGEARSEVLSPDDYPVGSEVRLAVDGQGLRQLVSEPYDITPWLAPVVIALGAGAAEAARVRRRRRGLRSLFDDPQPVRPVRVVDDFGYVHVLMPSADGRSALEFGIDVDEPALLYAEEHALDEEPETVPALLYGEPRPGGWLAVEVGGRLRVPVAPVAGMTEVPYDPEHALPREVFDDDHQAVDPARLLAADRDAAPDQVREHRVAPVRRWFEAIAIGLGASVTAGEVVRLLGGRAVVPVIAVVAALAYEFGWRTQLRPRLLWDVGGIAAISFRHRERAVWDADSAVVHDDDGTVIVITGDVVLAVDAPAPWPSWTAQRTAEQLVAALRDTRRQALDTAGAPAPPDVAVPGRPLLLYAVWIATVVGAVALSTG